MIIAARHLGYAIAGKTVFSGIDLDAVPGTVTALTGPSGSGKSALLHTLGLLIKPSVGDVSINGDSTTDWSVTRRRRFWGTSAAFVLQAGDLVEEETIAYNVTMSKTLLRGRVNGDAGRVSEALSAVGLGGRERERTVGLSGGEKQRLSFARALYRSAQVVYVDEPTASLDSGHSHNLGSMMRDIADQGSTVIVASHDPILIARADQVVDVAAASAAHGQSRPTGQAWPQEQARPVDRPDTAKHSERS